MCEAWIDNIHAVCGLHLRFATFEAWEEHHAALCNRLMFRRHSDMHVKQAWQIEKRGNKQGVFGKMSETHWQQGYCTHGRYFLKRADSKLGKTAKDLLLISKATQLPPCNRKMFLKSVVAFQSTQAVTSVTTQSTNEQDLFHGDHKCCSSRLWWFSLHDWERNQKPYIEKALCIHRPHTSCIVYLSVLGCGLTRK